MTDRLAPLARLRSLQAKLARRDLAVALQAGAQADAALATARAAPATEAGHLPQEPLLAAAFAAWLPHSAAAIERARAASLEAARACGSAAAALAERQRALETVSALQDQRRAAARAHALRQAQIGLDDLAVARRRS